MTATVNPARGAVVAGAPASAPVPPDPLARSRCGPAAGGGVWEDGADADVLKVTPLRRGR
ncbi:hypothetical protein GCM10009602_20430 [Nocardiopsis tropica]